MTAIQRGFFFCWFNFAFEFGHLLSIACCPMFWPTGLFLDCHTLLKKKKKKSWEYTSNWNVAFRCTWEEVLVDVHYKTEKKNVAKHNFSISSPFPRENLGIFSAAWVYFVHLFRKFVLKYLTQSIPCLHQKLCLLHENPSALWVC